MTGSHRRPATRRRARLSIGAVTAVSGVLLVGSAGFAAVQLNVPTASDSAAANDAVVQVPAATATAAQERLSRSQSRATIDAGSEVEAQRDAAAVSAQQAEQRRSASAAAARAAAKEAAAAAAAKAAAEPSTVPCATGSGVEAGLQPDTIAVHRAVCAQFPDITTYGGVAAREDHATGRALDIMVSGEHGWEIAKWVREHASDLGVSYIIYSQQIWSVQRSSEGWRAMSDRGGATANHYDHVHVSTYGSAAQ